MVRLQALTSASLFCLSLCQASGAGNGPIVADMSVKRVAIIGAGAGGSSAAYHLAYHAHKTGIKPNITVFERSNYVGGRSTTINVWDDPAVPIELGGSIFVKINRILYNAVDTFNLTFKSEDDAPDLPDTPDLGIWNGNEFVLKIDEGGWWDKAKLLWKYKLAPIRTQRLMKNTVGKFLKMYERPFFPWKSLSAAVQDIGLVGTTGITGQHFLKENGVRDDFAQEVVQASTRVNYAQNLPLIHGLETMVCMAAEGAHAVQGGNWQIFSNFIKASGARLNLNTSVTKISKRPDNTYELTTSSTAPKVFDTVILASPLQFSKLVIDPLPKHVPDQIPYVELHVTLFATPLRLSPNAFNLPPNENVPQAILTTLPPDENLGADRNGVGKPGFFSISVVGEGKNPQTQANETIYKIFSPKRTDDGFLAKILGQKEGADPFISWVHRKVWNSYPYEYPRVTFDEVELDEELYYTSGIESFISTMETSALSGWNVAALVVKGWQKKMSEEEKGAKKSDLEETLEVKKGEWEFQGLEQGEQKPLKAKL